MIDRRSLSTALIAGVAASLLGHSSKAQAQPAITARNVVLVHGAYADGSCWSEVIGRLQLAGLKATAVQNPQTSLADDVAATHRILALQDGPKVLVGHSWAGMVITEAGVDPKVSALVYVAALYVAWFRINEPSSREVDRVDLSDQFHQTAKN